MEMVGAIARRVDKLIQTKPREGRKGRQEVTSGRVG